MSLTIPHRWLALLVVATVVAAAAFAFLNRQFAGPGSQIGGGRYELQTKLADSQQLVTKSLVMVRGVRVGEVTGLKRDQTGATVTFTVDDELDGVGNGATATVGWRTAFGEAYLNLDRGDLDSARLPSGSEIPGRDSVQADEALSVADAATRNRFQGAARELATGLRSPQAADDARRIIAGVNRSVAELDRLTGELEGQGDDLARLIAGGQQVVGALAERENALRAIVRNGQVTLRALAAGSDRLTSGIRDLPALTREATATLEEIPGLLAAADRVTGDLSHAVGELRPAVQQAGPATASARGLAASMPELARSGVPALDDARPVIDGLEPTGRNLEPVLRNIIPLARWINPRARDYAGVFANLASATASGDSDGRWLRLFVFPDALGTEGKEMTVTCGKGTAGGACFNPYPAAGDATENRPYTPGSYERLLPYPKP